MASDICQELVSRGFTTDHVDSVDAAVDSLSTGTFDLLILDRMLNQADSLGMVKHLRSAENKVPILFVSGMARVDDRIEGLAAGGDDYLTKPFSLGELAARVEALLRRPSMRVHETSIRVGSLTVDLIERSAQRGDRHIALLPSEYRILEYLARRPNQVITREMLLKDVWGYKFLPKTNLVDVHLGKLRRKLDTASEVPMVQSIRALGFMLKADL